MLKLAGSHVCGVSGNIDAALAQNVLHHDNAFFQSNTPKPDHVANYIGHFACPSIVRDEQSAQHGFEVTDTLCPHRVDLHRSDVASNSTMF